MSVHTARCIMYVTVKFFESLESRTEFIDLCWTDDKQLSDGDYTGRIV